jgi:tRNA-2-methylthio-N6-dimethylallyladenosine synthase
MNYFLQTYGCQYNEWEAARINFMLQKIGFTETDQSTADVIFIIACAVLQDKTIIISGCIIDADKTKFEKRNAHLWDTKNAEELKQILDIKDESSLQTLLESGIAQSSYLPIMTGCNNFCSYCAVPYTKGRETSRPFDDIVNDFKILTKTAKEITLLGQNVNSYKYDFPKLLRTLNDLEGDFTISFTSNHPKDMTDDVISAIAESKKVKKSIHLPLQSGSDQILRAMNRPYTSDQYLQLVDKIKSRIPDVEITTDVIVGFPQETENDFQSTVEIFKKVRFHTAFVNKYSPRVGTNAYKLGDPIKWSEKERRWHVLNDIHYHKKY